MWSFELPNVRFRGFTRSYDKTSYRILKRGPGSMIAWHARYVCIWCSTFQTSREPMHYGIDIVSALLAFFAVRLCWTNRRVLYMHLIFHYSNFVRTHGRWRYGMKMVSALMILFLVRLLNKHVSCQGFETPWRSFVVGLMEIWFLEI